MPSDPDDRGRIADMLEAIVDIESATSGHGATTLADGNLLVREDSGIDDQIVWATAMINVPPAPLRRLHDRA
jgi:hypothetical protein